MRFGMIAVACLVFMIQSVSAAPSKTRKGKQRELSAAVIYYSDACADHWGVPRELMRAIMIQESGGNPKAVSTKNAQGLMQLLPSTAERYGVSDSFSPGDNACGAAHYLSDLMHEFGDLREVVAAYYCGEHRIEHKGLGYSNPGVTAYVKSVRALYVQELTKEGLYEQVASR
jgi:hypothetical protein